MSTLPAWTEVLVAVPCGWQELVAEVLQLSPCTSVAFGAPSLGSEPAPEGCEYVRTFVPRQADSSELRARLGAALADLARATGAPELAGLVPRFKHLPPEDYARSWEKVWKPFRVGRLAVLRPKDVRATRATDLVLRLEPGGVFGTGRHATTRLCLAALQDLVRPGEHVLDCGTGTGILAVAALLLGAEHALGFDIDSNSAPHAEHLASLNGCGARLELRTGGFECLAASDRAFDGLCTNIYSDILQERAADMAAALRPGGWFVLSGCTAEHAAPVRAALERAHLRVLHERARGRWRAFAGRLSS